MKLKKILFSILGFLLVSASVFTICFCVLKKDNENPPESSVGAATFSSGSGTEDDPYLITSLADLQILQTNVNAGEPYSGIYFLQTVDIDLSNVDSWDPIGNQYVDSSLLFSGIYNGGNFSISGLTNTNNFGRKGLFGWIENSEIKNVNLQGASIKTQYGSGFIAGYAKNSKILNCNIYDSVMTPRTDASVSMLGGIVGEARNYIEVVGCGVYGESSISGTYGVGGIIGSSLVAGDVPVCIKDCYSEATISAEYGEVGGIVGYCNWGLISSCINLGSVEVTNNTEESKVGGIVGHQEYGMVTECYNGGDITGVRCVGGIIGDAGLEGNLASSEDTRSYVTKCYNYGNIKISSKFSSDTDTTTSAGGIIGVLEQKAQVSDCYNIGNVNADSIYGSSIAGIVGKTNEVSTTANETTSNAPYIARCYNRGMLNGAGYIGGVIGRSGSVSRRELYYSYNIGQISSSYSFAGGILTYLTGKETIEECYWDTDCGVNYAAPTSNPDGTYGLADLDTELYAKNADWEFYSSYWDFENVWTFVSGANEDYPILIWQTETISFDPNGGEGEVSEIHAFKDDVVNLRDNTFTRAGFAANGWNESTTLTDAPKYLNGAEFVVVEDITLYANWLPNKAYVYVRGMATEIGRETPTSPNYIPDGCSVIVEGYTTTLSGNSTTFEQSEIINSGDYPILRTGQSIKITVCVPENWICSKLEIVSHENGSDNYIIYRTNDSQLELTYYLEDYSNPQWNIDVYFSEISDNQLKYDDKFQYFYFEDGMMAQSAVVTYDTAFNERLTNFCDENGAEEIFESNGLTFKTTTYLYNTTDDMYFEAYNGRKFLGFVMPANKTVVLRDLTSDDLSYTSYNFEIENTYWFEFEPVKWRVSDYGVSITELPADWDTLAEGQINFDVLSDVLWWDVLNDNSVNLLGFGNNATQTTFMQNLSNGTSVAEIDFAFEYSLEGAAISIDTFAAASVGNVKIDNSLQTWYADLRVSSVEEIEIYQSELNSYASALVCVLAGKNQDEFVEYWTRDFGQQLDCGTYITKSGTVLTNSYWNTQKGVRFSICMSEGSYVGV